MENKLNYLVVRGAILTFLGLLPVFSVIELPRWFQTLLASLIAIVGFSTLLVISGTIRELNNEVKDLKEKLKSNNSTDK